MINYFDKFFELNILKIKDIKLHETTETKRLRNIFDRIAGSKYLNNPVIVGKVKNDFLLIDGANRLSTLNDLGCKLALAQVIDYMSPQIKLKSWNHHIYNFPKEKLFGFFARHSIRYKEININEAEQIRKKRLNVLIASDIESGQTYIAALPKNFEDMIQFLNSLTALYFNKYTFDRSEEEIRFSELRKYTRKKGMLLEFPRFKKHHVIKAAASKYKIPAGITRHILVNRVLHVRYELKKLKSENGIVQKNKDLKAALLKKIDANKVRQYKESVIVFDE
jgi:hypothetical protein